MWCHLLQMTSQPQPSQNLTRLRHWLSQLPTRSEPSLLVLPECALCFGSEGGWASLAEPDLKLVPDADAPMQRELAALAQQHGLYLVAGTLPIQAEDGRAYAASLVYGPDGQRLGRYDKIHLFDVDVEDDTGRYRESTHTHPGAGITVVDTPLGRLGIAVCYDVRFPELFRALADAGAELVALPAAFTEPTGEAHWEVLLRARAIENQCYLLAAGQQGQHANGRRTWGHSMVVDPWGRVVAQLAQGEGLVSARIDPAEMAQIRQRLPALKHRRLP
ncbi:Nitrilase/cyanide hydratase and apolipoprotein N-acyltransferase [Ferrimonas balearica DSM 9799]|uniref:Nitrilase/cyanide hydratase and apolipoprotein N-acyltransferase n=1 Tax=Ferrimonas balearica (strain DSM 9799 / CCM 4581 / KCTC 23876 / PAT) TaxID=550540 RepID=E1SME7_FERBD|nr:carbon-nitrogen hydrolase family protein [Ferrimonas balearica]ADN77656.1 Nitrilase/cyanide hydratase and apolipoprotein N-acyltransferase [Ferrimonas balearica DSM 9799]